MLMNAGIQLEQTVFRNTAMGRFFSRIFILKTRS